MRIETQARELALKALYQHDLLGGRTPEELRAFCHEQGSPEAATLAMALVEGCLRNHKILDDILRRTAENWELERMATSDRNILRLATYELLFRPETPPKVAINEAIELAKKYSTENSPTFVNGVLDRIYATEVLGRRGGLSNSHSPAANQPTEADPTARADLHVHSSASDGTNAPAELAGLAASAGLRAFALTDHDSVEGVKEARLAACAAGIELIAGVELTAYLCCGPDAPEVELHVAGLFVDDACPALLERLESLRRARVKRVFEMAAKLKKMGLAVEPENVLARARGASVGRMHVAQELVARGFCRSIADAFAQHLSPGCPAYVPREEISPAQAIALVKAAGGCAVLCHPGLLPDVESHIPSLIASGLDAIEVHSPTHTAEDEKRFMDLALRHGLVIAGGSDYHGQAKPNVRIGQQTVSLVEVAELRRRAMDRASVRRV